jgi:hypothetical protein
MSVPTCNNCLRGAKDYPHPREFGTCAICQQPGYCALVEIVHMPTQLALENANAKSD